MLRSLSAMSNERPLSELLILLGPTVNEVANYYITAICLQVRSSSFPQALPRRYRAFQHHVRYWDVIRQFGAPLKTWQDSGLVEATNDVLGDFIAILTHCLHRMSLRDLTHDVEKDALVETCLKDMNAEMNDPDLLYALRSIKTSSQTPSSHSNIETHLRGHIYLTMRSIALTRAILKSPSSLLEGLDSPEATLTARILCSSYRSEFPSHAPFKTFCATKYSRIVTIAGLALSMGEIKERKCLFETKKLTLYKLVVGLLKNFALWIIRIELKLSRISGLRGQQKRFSMNCASKILGHIIKIITMLLYCRSVRISRGLDSWGWGLPAQG
jgi:hypothetical protein